MLLELFFQPVERLEIVDSLRLLFLSSSSRKIVLSVSWSSFGAKLKLKGQDGNYGKCFAALLYS